MTKVIQCLGKVNFVKQKVKDVIFFKSQILTKILPKFLIQLLNLQYLDSEILHIEEARAEEERFLIKADKNSQMKGAKTSYKVNQI